MLLKTNAECVALLFEMLRLPQEFALTALEG